MGGGGRCYDIKQSEYISCCFFFFFFVVVVFLFFFLGGGGLFVFLRQYKLYVYLGVKCLISHLF